MKKYRIVEYKEGKRRLNAYMQNKKEYAIIHYSCQSFYNDLCGKSPRIIAICILLPFYGQTNTFSIPSVAEEKAIDLSIASESKLDELEAEMLKQYYSYIKAHSHISKWIHWNMRNSSFGFQAIDHRYSVLTKKKAPILIGDDKKLNLSWLLSCIYGSHYITDPKLVTLLEKNNIHPLHLLSGADEASAFEKKEYLSMERSAHAKVGCFAEILERASNNELKTECKTWKDIYGFNFLGVIEYIKDNALLALIASALGGVLINIISGWVTNLFSK